MKQKLFFLLALLCVMVQGVFADKWDGFSTSKPAWDGSAAVIKTAAELAYIRDHWAEGSGYDGDKYFYQLNYRVEDDLDMSVKNWVPMWDAYRGTFNGNGHTIRIVIDDPNLSSNYQGLFAHIHSSGKVEHVHVDGNINVGNARLVGGIAGENDGEILDCWVSADVKSNHYSVYAASLGGICGKNYGTIRYCCMSGNVTNLAGNSGVGGLIGCNETKKVGFCTDCMFYGDVNTNHSQGTPYIGDDVNGAYYYPGVISIYNPNVLNTIPGENYVYRDAFRYPYSCTVSISGTGTLEPGFVRGFPGETITQKVTLGVSVSMSVDKVDGGSVGISGNDVSGYTFRMPNRNVIAKAVFYDGFPTQGAGTESNPYIISSTEDWEAFARQVGKGFNFSGKYIKLVNDLSVSTMVGTDEGNSFQGIFEGNGKTLTFNYNMADNNYAAPFCYTKNANIANLHVTGTIRSFAQYAGGIVAQAHGGLTLRNCRSSVTIECSKHVEGMHGGLVARLNANGGKVIIDGCLFDGVFTTSNYTFSCGGFVGYSENDSVTVSNSLMLPKRVYEGMISYTFVNHKGTQPTITNCYSAAPANLPGNQGKRACSVKAGDEYVIIKSVSPVGGSTASYNVSGITTYNMGMTCDGTFYYGNEDEVVLTLTNTAVCPEPGYSYGYKVSAGTLNGSNLRMPNEDVFISIDTQTKIPEDWAIVSTGDKDDPYIIYTVEGLNLLAQRVNQGNQRYEGKFFKLGADITYSHTTAWDDPASTENNFTPIAYYNNFGGNFDGAGHTISGIRIYSNSDTNTNPVGLFAKTDMNACIRGVTLSDTRMFGYMVIGGIVGFPKNSNITDCHVTNTVCLRSPDYLLVTVGGIVGNNYRSNISHCTSSVVITSTAGTPMIQQFGGIIGESSNYESLTSENMVIGAVIPTSMNGYHGAVVGSSSGEHLRHNYYTGCTVAGVENATNVGNKAADVQENDGAVSISPIAGSGTEADPFIISSTGEWNLFAYNIRNGNNYSGQFVKLDADINVSTIAGSQESYPFSGTFDGGLHTITATITDNADYTALFRYINGATIKNLKVAGTIDGGQYAAAIVGAVQGTGDNTIENCVATANVVGGSHIGGIVGNGQAGNVSMTGCVYAGLMKGGTEAKGALFGWCDNGGTKTATDCLYLIQEEQKTDNLDLVKGSGEVTLTNCYKTDQAEYDRAHSAPRRNRIAPEDESWDYDELYYGIWANIYDVMPDYLGKLWVDYGFLKVYDGGLEYEGWYIVACISLADDNDNNALIELATDYIVDVTLTDRTLYKDNAWQTLCLPFNLDDFAGTPLEGATVKTLVGSTYDESTGTLTLDFSDNLTAIEAGKPYIVRRPNGVELANPMFRGVVVSTEITAVYTNYIDFAGTYRATTFDEDNPDILLLNADATLSHPKAGESLGSCHAYFPLKYGLTADKLQRIVLNNIEDGTAIETVTGEQKDKVVKYIEDGKLYIRHSDNTYDATGRSINR